MFDFYEMDGWSTVLTKQLAQMLVNDILFSSFFIFCESQSFGKICVTFKGFVSISLKYPNIKYNNNQIRLFINGAIFQLFLLSFSTEKYFKIYTKWIIKLNKCDCMTSERKLDDFSYRPQNTAMGYGFKMYIREMKRQGTFPKS